MQPPNVTQPFQQFQGMQQMPVAVQNLGRPPAPMPGDMNMNGMYQNPLANTMPIIGQQPGMTRNNGGNEMDQSRSVDQANSMNVD